MLRVLCTLLLVSCVACSRILVVFHMLAPSHNILGIHLARALAARGHEVTFIGSIPHKETTPNLTDIYLDGLKEKLSDKKGNMYDMATNNIALTVTSVHKMGISIADEAFNHEKVQKLLKSDAKFDLVITQMFFNEFHFGLAVKYNCPLIVFSTVGANIWVNHLVGNPSPMSYNPDLFLHYSPEMTFPQRMYNFLFTTGVSIARYLFYFPEQNRLLKKHFGEDMPELNEIMKNKVSMVLMNSHSAIGTPKPTVPAMVEIGGYHVQDPKPLPKDLQKWMDDSTMGVILFSMGSNLKSSELPPEKKEAILKAFSKVKMNVLWKWEEDEMPGQPKNVRTSKWVPQNDVLAHPNLRVFITHGGLLSTIEATFHGVPVIGIPIFGDQKANIASVVLRGYGLQVDYQSLTEQKLTDALNEIITNPTYHKNIRQRSTVLRDQPLRPLDAGIFWVEHVIRHKGAAHFRMTAVDLSWCELHSVDVMGVLFALVLAFCLLLRFAVRKICCRTKSRKVVKDAKKKKN